ncbi:hypothetical protein B0H13DRAFT_2318290 [Mycena leptocephala]|nr:hypothetical protein B0H13DRAFT_2318290 [Mycena leptocephala]
MYSGDLEARIPRWFYPTPMFIKSDWIDGRLALIATAKISRTKSIGINLASSRSAPTPNLSANVLSPTSREFQALLAMYCAGLAWRVFLFACAVAHTTSWVLVIKSLPSRPFRGLPHSSANFLSPTSRESLTLIALYSAGLACPSLLTSLGFRALDILRWSLSPGSSSIHYAELERRRQKAILPTLITFHSSADSTDPEIDFGPGT